MSLMLDVNIDPQSARQVVVGILKRCEGQLLEMRDMEKMVDNLKREITSVGRYCCRF